MEKNKYPALAKVLVESERRTLKPEQPAITVKWGDLEAHYTPNTIEIYKNGKGLGRFDSDVLGFVKKDLIRRLELLGESVPQ